MHSHNTTIITLHTYTRTLYKYMHSNTWQELCRSWWEISSQNVQWVAPGGAVTCKLHKIQDPDGPELKSSKNLGKIQMAQIASFVEHGQT